MTYKQLKWFILLIPTITVGLWEYVRHEYLLPYISMDLGNWLTPVIVLFVSFTLLTRFFTKMERIQEELNIERAEKAVMEERERIARDLHDGMAQSLFLLSIKIQQLNQLDVPEKDRELFNDLNENIIHIHEYVRYGIKNLKTGAIDLPWLDAIHKQIEQFEKDSTLEVEKTINIDEALLSAEEKFELISCLSEALINIQKHANASFVRIDFHVTLSQKQLHIIDNGRGFPKNKDYQGCYGLKIMKERSERIGWEMNTSSENGETIVSFIKEERK